MGGKYRMKSKFIILILSLSCFFVACNWQIPEKVKVKAEPTFNFCAGTVKTDFSENLNFDEILFDAINSADSSIKMYNYLPEGKVRQYAMRMSVVEVPVDFSSYFENTGISDAMKGMSFEQEIEVPNISLDIEEKIDVSEVKKAINSAIYYVSNEMGKKFVSTFDTIVYDSITFNLDFFGACPDGTYVEIISGGNLVSGTFYKNEPFIRSSSSFTINYSDFDVRIYSENGDSIPYVINVDENSNIREIKNFSSPVDKPVSFPFEISFSLKNNNESFKSCVIGEGDLITNLSIPESWKGVDVSYDFNANGAINVSATKDGGLQKTIHLNGKKLKNDKTIAKSNIEMSIKNADLAFTTNQNLKLNISSDIQKLQSLTVNLDSANPKMEMTEPFSTEMMETIKEIDLNSGSGIEIEYTNTLPPENNIKLKASSDIFAINDETTLESNQENKNTEIVSKIEKHIIVGNGGDEYNSFDFNIELGFPDATDENPNEITIKNVTLGDKYTLKVNVKPVINWEKIVLSNNLTESLSVKDKVSLPVSLDDISKNMASVFGDEENLISKLKIKSIPVYLFCTKPTVKEGEEDLFANMSFSGKLKMYYGTEEGCVNDDSGKELEVNLVGDDTEVGKIEFFNSPDLIFSQNAKSLLTDLKDVDFSASTDIAHLLNPQPNNNQNEENSLYVEYDLKFENSNNNGELTITNDMLENKSSLSVFSYIILPLEFGTTGELNFNANEIAGDAFSGDIFGRTDENTNLGNLEDYIDYIRSATIKYESISLPIKTDTNESMKFNLKMKCGKEDSIDLSKNGSYLNGGEFKITAADVNKMIDNYPAIPDFSIKIDDGTGFYIPQTMDVAIKLNLSVETNIDIEL